MRTFKIGWESIRYNFRGGKLFDFLTPVGLMTTKVRCAPTYVGTRKSEIISNDLIICAPKMLEFKQFLGGERRNTRKWIGPSSRSFLVIK